ncbi:MAG: glycosyltransferase family 39 protein [Ferruginibacter sp.]
MKDVVNGNFNRSSSMRKKIFILIGFILAKFLLQYLLFNPDYDLQRDEYLHLDQANHLAWGFQSLPPVTSWIAYIIKLLGNGVFWVKFFPALFGTFTIVVVWKTIEALKGNLFALILGATCMLLSALLRLNFLFQPNSFDVLCWTAFYYFVIKYINTENVKWLFICSFIFAIGFLNKYNIIFLLIGLFPAILLTDQRKVFAKKEFYFAIVFGLLLILPNLLWQYNNGFPVFHHLKELADTQLVNVNRFDFLKEQFLFFVGALPVIAAALYALLFHKPFQKFRLFFGTIIFTLIIFICFKAKGYYAIGLYPVYISFGSAFLSNKLNTGWRKYLQPILLAVPIIFYVFLFNIVFSVKAPNYYIDNNNKYKELGMLRWEDGKDHLLPQDFADMLGWKELAKKVDAVYTNLTNKDQTIIVCDNYGQAGAINYYTSNKNIKAVSFSADYINWFDLDTKIENFIRVKEFDSSDKELQETSPFFETAYVADSVTNSLAREYGTTIFVFTKSKIDINQRLKTELDKKKN